MRYLHPPRRRLPTLVAALACTVLLTAPSALARTNAAVVAVAGDNELRLEPTDPAQAMRMTVGTEGALVRVTDAIGGVTAGAGCLQDGLAAVCASVSAIHATGSSSGDLLRNDTGLRSTLVGAAGGDALIGGANADLLDAGSGDDFTDGREGDDRLPASAGADAMLGGGGIDAADYSARNDSVVISLDGQADDGTIILERDQVDPSVETVISGSGQDNLVGSDGANRLEGGPGFDIIDGEGGNDAIAGGDGPDSLKGSAGNDTVDGGGGNDQIDGGDGADDMRGGPGVDQVAYIGRTAGIAVTLDDNPNDGLFTPFGGSIGAGFGSTPEQDNVHSDVENLSTGEGNDIVVAGPGANQILTRGGNDVVDGGTGPDRIDAGDGSDRVNYAGRTSGVTVTLGDGLPDDGDATDGPVGARDTLLGTENVTGGSGPDTLTGDARANVLIGGPGGDTITGLGNADILRGDQGDDVLRANDGVKDTVNCGSDADEAELDLADAPLVNGVRQVPATCESVTIAPVGELPTVAIASRALRRHNGIVRVALHCPRKVKTKACVGRLTLAAVKRPRRILAATRYRLARGRRGRVKLRLVTGARLVLVTATGPGKTGPQVSVARLRVK
jgi:Ca2+-binding RTX toxin-like protein